MPEKENEAGRAAVGESGRLRIMVTSSIGMIPVQNARITISYKGCLLYTSETGKL